MYLCKVVCVSNYLDKDLPKVSFGLEFSMAHGFFSSFIACIAWKLTTS